MLPNFEKPISWDLKRLQVPEDEAKVSNFAVFIFAVCFVCSLILQTENMQYLACLLCWIYAVIPHSMHCDHH